VPSFNERINKVSANESGTTDNRYAHGIVAVVVSIRIESLFWRGVINVNQLVSWKT